MGSDYIQKKLVNINFPTRQIFLWLISKRIAYLQDWYIFFA